MGAVLFATIAVITVDSGLRLRCGALTVMALWGAWWVRLTVTPSGLTVVFIRSRRVPWSDVKRLSVDPRRWRWAGSVLTVLTREGESVRVWAVSSGPRDSVQFCKETLRSLEVARRQHRS